MAVITNSMMQSKPKGVDVWFTQPFKRGAGAFIGRITPSGERLFYFRYTDSAGRRPFLPIAPYSPRGVGGLTLADAFKKASDWSLRYQSGARDLREHLAAEEAQEQADRETERRLGEEAKAAAARRLTVRQLFDQWQRAELAPQTLADGTRTGRKDGGEWVKQSFERRLFPRVGDTPASDITRADLMAVIDDARSGGRLRTANVLFTDLRQMFRFALEREIVERNPLDGIRRRAVGGKEVERDRVLTDGELVQLLDALPAARMTPRSVVAVNLILATAARVGEAMGARWEDVDLKRRRWHLPDTKNQRSHTIHLSDFAVMQFETLAGLRERLPSGDLSAWVFPATDPAKPVCVKSFGKQLADRQRKPERQLSRRTKATSVLALPGGRWTAHDLRRTAATILARLGFSTDVIDECLNHKLQSKVARVYIRDRREADQARAFDALGRHLQQLADAQHQELAGNVVHMTTRAA